LHRFLEFAVKCGYTALISAVDKGHADTVKLLLKAGAEMEAMNVVSQSCIPSNQLVAEAFQ
jgi:ankyrin repeat protein